MLKVARLQYLNLNVNLVSIWRQLGVYLESIWRQFGLHLEYIPVDSNLPKLFSLIQIFPHSSIDKIFKSTILILLYFNCPYMYDKVESKIKYPDITIKIGDKVIGAKEAADAILSWVRENLVDFFSACEGNEKLLKDSTIELGFKTVGSRDVSHTHLRGIRGLLEDYSGNETADKK